MIDSKIRRLREPLEAGRVLMPHPTAAPILIYGLSTCPRCRRVRRLLEEQGLDCRSLELDLLDAASQRAALEELGRCNPAQSLPTTLIGSRVIVGWQEDELRRQARKVADRERP